MKCKKCGVENAPLKKTCYECGSILEGFCKNNVTGKYGYRNADGNFEEIKIPISQAAALLGRKGGLVKSEKKAKSSRENGKKGGYPKGRPRKKS